MQHARLRLAVVTLIVGGSVGLAAPSYAAPVASTPTTHAVATDDGPGFRFRGGGEGFRNRRSPFFFRRNQPFYFRSRPYLFDGFDRCGIYLVYGDVRGYYICLSY